MASLTAALISQVVNAADQVAYGNTLYSPQHATINASANGLNSLVAAVAGYVIIVLQYTILCSGAVTVSWESSGGTVLSGPMAYVSGAGAATPFSPVGHFQSLSGEGMDLNLGSGVQVGGHLTYIVVP